MTTAPAQSLLQKAEAVLASAKQSYSADGPRAALPQFEQALALFRQAGDGRGEAVTLGLIGNCYKREGDFDKALDHLQRALAMKRRLGDAAEEGKTLSHLGLLHWEMGQYPRAVEHFTQAIQIGNKLGDRVLEASARNNLGLVYDETGEYRRSLAEYNRALELYKEAARHGTSATIERGVSDAVGNIGGQHLLLGEYAEALRFYREALATDERLGLKPAMSQDLGNIALCHLGLGRTLEAIQHFDRAFALAQEVGLKKEAADWQKGKGSALVQAGKYTAALDHYRQALQTYERAGLRRELVDALGDLGGLELQLGDAASAEREFRRAIELSRAINYHNGVTNNLIALGGLELRRKRHAEASALYAEALDRADTVSDKAGSATARVQLALTYRETGRLEEAQREAGRALEIARETKARPLEAAALCAQGEVSRSQASAEAALKQYLACEAVVRETLDPELGWRAAFGRGRALESLGRDEEALGAYREAIRVIELVRGELREERFRAGYAEDKYQAYVALVQLLLKLGRADEAFVFSERLRARSYMDLLGRGRPPIRSAAQRQTEATLRSRVRQFQRKIEAEAARAPAEQRRQTLDFFSQELAGAERDYQNFLGDLTGTEPDYAAALALRVPSVEDVRGQLPARAALVEYVLADESLSIFVVTPGGVRATTVAIRRADLIAKVELLRDLIGRPGTDDWKLPAASLHRALLAPVEAAGWLRGVNRLYVVAHADLHYVPFAALLRTEAGGSRFVGDDYVLAYLPAAAALVFGKRTDGPGKSLLALSPARTRLRHTERESRGVSGFYPNRHTLLTGGRATESSFKRLAGGHDVIHLATHGFFNKLNPLLSGVALEPDAQEDGRLEVHEILDLRLDAKLVTLSACDTGLGGGYFADVPAGDDLVGLTRAFLFAGSSSVLASLWEVNDLAAVGLMSDFYGRLGREDKAAALAGAQRNMRRRGGRYGHPYYWGAFSLAGRMD